MIRLRARAALAAALSLSLTMGWLVWSTPASAATNIAASYVIGQGGSFTTTNAGSTAAKLAVPGAVVVDTLHHRMFVADTTNNRVVEYNLNSNNTLPDDTADFVLGQTGFGVNTSGLTATTMNAPIGLAYDANNDRLFVADNGNDRVLVFNSATLTNGMAATFVLGQADFVSSTRVLTQSGVNLTPAYGEGLTLTSNSQYLFVPDRGNNRLMVWDVSSLSNGKNATYVLGQSSFTANVYSPANAASEKPQGTAIDPSGTYLYVAEADANRVDVFTLSALATGMASTFVIGQPNTSSTASGTSQTQLATPNGVAVGNGKVYVSDSANQRVMIYDASITTNGQTAIGEIGQPNFTSNTPNNGGTSATSLNYIRGGLTFDPTTYRLYIADYQNNRVLGYDTTSADTNVYVQIDPTFAFTVANQPSACNGESNFLSAAGSATAVALGHAVASSNVSGGQLLSVNSNAGGGFSIYVRGAQATQNLRSSSYNWTDVSGTYASPAALGSGEKFGYTYKDYGGTTSVINPGSATFAALTSTSQAVMGSVSATSGTGCVSFDAQTAATTPAGSYSGTIIYTAVPVF